MSKLEWRRNTRNCHSAYLDDAHVANVERPQKNQPDGTKYSWQIVILGDRYTWDKTFTDYDPRDLESTKLAAEARAKFAIETLYRRLKVKR